MIILYGFRYTLCTELQGEHEIFGLAVGLPISPFFYILHFSSSIYGRWHDSDNAHKAVILTPAEIASLAIELAAQATTLLKEF